ncbi:uncharacterized protein BXZ73DRAFT_92068 [Epithele typhae]|uniref:uncharacterized protein n=1 Tax=Epithele typhae TaxID=378194 RepID=UPI002007E6B9|nr:uncharacterized protein BXZ73DRAFT_92068 [Epithele typhae]KAH9919468.1 hypothetical protein BXZ73DRAFT_92068 [Epithele typhae]
MTQSVTESSISPGPLSPFSTFSVGSGVTSDDAPDLGAFGTVFRALTNLHPLNGTDVRSATPTSSFALSHSDDSDPLQGPSNWSQRRVSSYLTSSLPGSPMREAASLPLDTEDTASEYDDGTELEVPIEDENAVDRPSLGYLDQALMYLAAEREKLTLQRELRGAGSTTTSDSPSQFPLPAIRRKRRRKSRSARKVAPEDGTRTETATGEGEGQDEASADNEDGDYSSSSREATSSSPRPKTTPATPATFRREKQKQRAAAETNPRLHHSRSTPSLHVTTRSFDAQTIQLRTLAHKLRLLFRTERQALLGVLSRDFTSSATYADPRGPAPTSQDTLIHVFIDHSNILIGFVNYAKRHLGHIVRKIKQTHLSHAALALVLERGRPVTRRVLVTSSPSTSRWTPRSSSGTSRGQNNHNNGNNNSNGAEAGPPRARGKARQPARGHAHKTSTGGNGTSTDPNANANGAAAARQRYREQGVDELLQLKLHQAIADVDAPPAGATIVLATGDGNVGQFNEDGFLGCVRTALKKGWRVELYAWEGGLSRAWNREFGADRRFTVCMLDDYAADLIEMPEAVVGGHGL